MNPLAICHVITRMNIGGAEENTLLTCMGLIEKGHDVTLITGPSTGPEGNLLADSDTTGLKVIEIPELVREISPKNDRKAYKKLLEIFSENHFDVIHTHASKAGILGRLAAWKANVPFVTHTVHGLPFHDFQPWYKNYPFMFAEYIAAKRCHKIFTVAQSMIDQCVEAHIAPREKYKVVYSGMDLESFMTALPDHDFREKLGIPVGVPVIGMIARMFPQKGYEDFLQIAPDILDAFPDARFLLVGDGDMRPAIEAKLSQLGIMDHCIFTGMVHPSEVCNYLPYMTLLLHLSYHEGLPRTAVQALAAKVPVVAYPVDGTPEVVVNGQNGYLVPTKNARMASEKAIMLIRKPSRRHEMGAAGQNKVKELFGTQKMVDTLEEEYLNALATHQEIPQ